MNIERGKFPDRADRIFKLAEFLSEPAELSPPVGALGSTREEDVPDSRLRITGRTIRDRHNASRLEMLAFRRILNLPFTVERRANRVSKRSACILDARITNETEFYSKP